MLFNSKYLIALALFLNTIQASVIPVDDTQFVLSREIPAKNQVKSINDEGVGLLDSLYGSFFGELATIESESLAPNGKPKKSASAIDKKNKNKVPKVFTLGGDHTITLPAIKAAYENWGPVSVIRFDSHLDTWNPYYFGGNVTDYQSVNHGTYLHWAHEKGLLSDYRIHAVIRGPYPGPRDAQNDAECGFDRILVRDIDKISTDGIVQKIKERVGDSAIYITVDVDSMDPANKAATGTVEPGGWTSRELYEYFGWS